MNRLAADKHLADDADDDAESRMLKQGLENGLPGKWGRDGDAIDKVTGDLRGQRYADEHNSGAGRQFGAWDEDKEAFFPVSILRWSKKTHC